jgi:raffinose/stachyose/melibiose transport system permease protein
MTLTAPRTEPVSTLPADTAPLRRRRLRSTASHVGLLLVTLIVIAPILLMVKVSLQSDADVAAHPLSWPSHLNLHNYTAAIHAMNYGRSLYNTVLITGGAAVLVMLTGSLAAWPISRISRRWTKAVYQLFVAGLTVPVFVMITPLYMFMRDLGLLDTYTSVILA